MSRRLGDESIRSRLERLPLRLRLVAVVLVLLVTALTVSGFASGLLLRRFLVDRIDDELRTYADVAAQVALVQYRAGDERSLLPPDYSVLFIPLDVGRTSPIQVLQAATEHSTPDVPQLAADDARIVSARPFTVGSTGPNETTWRVVAGVNQRRDAIYFVAKPLAGVVSTVTRFTWVTSLASILVLITCGLIGWYAVRRAFRPLTEIEDTAANIAAGDLSQRVQVRDSKDEVSSLARSLNVMLAQIEHSFAVRADSEERMRQFVADASHELRTPLATMRGYAELYRHGAVSSPEDIAGAMTRIESESTRMAGLVEDLLLLARLDGERPLDLDDVDLAVLGGDAVQDARVLDPGRQVRLVGSNGALGPVHVQGDEARLRQVFTNLVANALHHTPDGSPVEVAIGYAGPDAASIEVRDHGPGLDPAVARRVFERFFRADPSRVRRGVGGNGLGLAIVAAIVGAHRGQVAVTQTPGGGATFVVHLPTANSQAEPRTV